MSVVQLSLGDDAFRAQMLSDVLRDEGVRNELVLSEDPYGTLGGAYATHTVFVHDSDKDQAKQIIADHHPQLMGHSVEPPPASSVVSPSLRTVLGAILLVMVVPGLVYLILDVIGAFV